MANEETKLSAEELELLNSKISSIFGNLNVDSVTESSTGFDELSSGYYLCSCEGAKIKMSASGNFGAMLKLKTYENGKLDNVDDATGVTTFTTIEHSKNKIVNKWYSLKDEADAKKFISDILKFTDTDDHPLIPKNEFIMLDYDGMNQVLELLVGVRVWMYVDVIVDKETGAKSTWYNLLTWKRAGELGLSEA